MTYVCNNIYEELNRHSKDSQVNAINEYCITQLAAPNSKEMEIAFSPLSHFCNVETTPGT